MCLVDFIGYVACALVFATFYMTAMLPLRLTAIASNAAFIAYGYFGGMTPILLLHIGLLPLNVWRLHQALRCPAAPEDMLAAPVRASSGSTTNRWHGSSHQQRELEHDLFETLRPAREWHRRI